MASIDAHLDRRGGAESVESVQTRRRPVRCRRVRSGSEGRRHQPLLERDRCAVNGEHPGSALDEPSLRDRGRDAMCREVEFGSLAPGEHAVLSGGKLGDSVDRARRRHVLDGTCGVSQRRTHDEV